MNALYALWTLLFAWPLAFVMMIVTGLVALPLCLFDRFQGLPKRAASHVFWRVLYLALARLRIVYHPGYDPARVSLYVMNHTSMADAFVAVGTIRVPFCGLENAAHLHVPIYGWLMRLADAIPVPRGEGRTAALVEAARERKSRGISVLAFPEGHRTRDGKLRDFKRGAFVMAQEAGLPIVPVACRGLWHIYPRGAWYVRPGTIEVWVGPQIETAGADVDELVARVRGLIQAWVERGETPEVEGGTTARSAAE